MNKESLHVIVTLNPPLSSLSRITWSPRGSYSRGPAGGGWTPWMEDLWSRPYISERGLAARRLRGRRCLTPCTQAAYTTSEPSYSYGYRSHRQRFLIHYCVLTFLKNSTL